MFGLYRSNGFFYTLESTAESLEKCCTEGCCSKEASSEKSKKDKDKKNKGKKSSLAEVPTQDTLRRMGFQR